MRNISGPQPKKGQVWKRKRDGLEMLLVASKGSDIMRGVNLRNRKVQHHIRKKTLWIYWELAATEEKYGLD